MRAGPALPLIGKEGGGGGLDGGGTAGEGPAGAGRSTSPVSWRTHRELGRVARPCAAREGDSCKPVGAGWDG